MSSRTIKIYIIKSAGKKEKDKALSRSQRVQNLTIQYLAALCPEYCEVKIVDEGYDDIDFNFDADIVAITSFTVGATRAYEIAGKFKKEKGSWSVMGGTQATVMPEECMKYVDTVCVGEGDKLFPLMIDEFARTGKMQKIYRNDTALNLENLPLPRRDLVKKMFFLQGVQTARGCKNSCEFCFIRKSYGKGVRVRPVDEVIKEIEEIAWNHFIFYDDDIASNKSAIELFDKMAHLKKSWYSQSCISIATDDKLLKAAAKSGCKGLIIGIESVNQGSLNGMKKGFNKAQNYKDAVSKLHDNGIYVMASMSLGHDDDGPDVFEKTLEYLNFMGIDSIHAAIATPMPGTDFHQRLVEENRIFDHNWDNYDFGTVVFKPKKMTTDQLKDGFDWFYNEFYKCSNVFNRIKETYHLPIPTIFKLVISMTMKRYAKVITDNAIPVRS